MTKRRHLVDLDLDGNYLKNVGIEVLETLPTSHLFVGRIVSVDNKLYQCVLYDNNLSWKQLGEGGGEPQIGPQGATGASGSNGTQGTQGVQGKQGVQGNDGKSVQGTEGKTVQGTQGVQGKTGASIQGANGASIQGTQGVQGKDGKSVQGTEGKTVQGTKGDTVQGAKGDTVQGATGSLYVGQLDRPSFTSTQWANYMVIGNTETWINSGLSGRKGDIFTVTGVATDTYDTYTLIRQATSDFTTSTTSIQNKCIGGFITKRGVQGAQGKNGASVQGTKGDTVQGQTGATGYVSATANIPTAAGWYRIATSGSSISNNIGLFSITAAVSSYHSNIMFFAGSSYGTAAGTYINVAQVSSFSGASITKLRIVYHTTYSGNYAYLEVYKPATGSVVTTTVKMINSTGWSLVSPSTAGGIPSGYTSKEYTLTNGQSLQGAQGKTGASIQGNDGKSVQGAQGKTGTSIQGNDGKSVQGKTGDTGPSAWVVSNGTSTSITINVSATERKYYAYKVSGTTNVTLNGTTQTGVEQMLCIVNSNSSTAIKVNFPANCYITNPIISIPPLCAVEFSIVYIHDFARNVVTCSSILNPS